MQSPSGMSNKMATVCLITMATILLLPLPARGGHRISVWSGENLDDMLMKTDGSGATDKNAVLVIYDEHCTSEKSQLGVSAGGLPPVQTVAFLQHHYNNAQRHTWLRDNGDDLRFRFRAVNCPEVVFIARGTTKEDEAPVWNWATDEDDDKSSKPEPFTEWVWNQLRAKVMIKNFKDIAVKVRVDWLGLQGPEANMYPQFTMMPGEVTQLNLYESSLILTFAAGKRHQPDTFIGAWEVLGPTHINLINNPGDDRVEQNVLTDIRARFNKEEDRMLQWYNTNSARYLLNLKQPLFVPALTEHGYHLRSIPPQWYKVLKEFYQANKHKAQVESWPFIDSVINYDEVPNDMVQLSPEVKEQVSAGLQSLMEEWCDCQLELTAFYGVRVYHNGSILRNHVDRIDTHVVSAILQIDQEVRAPWRLEVIDYHGDRHHLNLSPGEMLLYESAKLIHGRPLPLDGDWYANVFLHFRPRSGWGPYHRAGGHLNTDRDSESMADLPSERTVRHAHQRQLFKVKYAKTLKDEL